MKRFPSVVVLSLLLFDVDAVAAPPSVDKWSLWSGPSVKLRGANVFQRRVYAFDGGFIGPGPFGPPMTQQDFNALAALGANFVNFSVPGLFTEDPPYVLDAAAQANLDNLVAMASQANLYAVIGFRTGPGRSEGTFGYFPPGYDNETVWTSQAAQDAWVAMWTATAQHYKANTAVIGYDLMVEPNSNATAVNPPVWDPPTFYGTYAGTLYDWNQLHPRISAGIRTTDTATPILTGGLSYSGIGWLGYITVTADAKTVYTVHYYEPFDYVQQNPPLTLSYPSVFDPGTGVPVLVDKSWLRGDLGPIDAFKAAHPGKPVAVNEFGVKRWEPGADAYFADVAAVLEEKGANRALWLWADSYAADQTADDFNFRHGADPNNHTDVATSPLIQAIVADFARNAAICPAITLSPASLPGGTVGTAYAATVTANGGTAPYTWSEAGTLPTGISFAGGNVSGTPTQSGTFPISVTATDAKGCVGTLAYSLVVAAAGPAQGLIIYDDALENGFQNWSYGGLPGEIDFASSAQVHSGTRSIAFTGDSYNAVSFAQPTQTYTVAQYPTLHFWVHGGTVGGQQLRLYLQTASGIVAQAPLGTYIAGGAIVAGAWREVTVNMGQAPLSYSGSFARIDLQSDVNGSQPVLYIDDVSLVAGSSGCTGPAPTPTINASGPTTFCAGGSVTLTASIAPASGVSYLWNPGGQTTQAIGVTTSGTYSVTVTVNGCAGTSPATVVTVNPAPATPSITAPASATPGQAGLTASVVSHVGSTYAWGITSGTITGGQGSSQIAFTAGASGTVTLTVVETNGGCLSAQASRSIPIGATSSTLQIEHDVTVDSMVSDRFTWSDGSGQPRVAVLAHNDGQTGPGGVRGGALREFRYQLPDGTTRVASVTTYGNGGYGGFGYVVSHMANSTCIGDDSPLGDFTPGQFQRVFEGRHHVIFRFTQNYPRNCSTTLPVQQRTVPVTIDWVFATGRDNPVWAGSWDLSGVPVNTFYDDSRGPYGELNIDGDGSTDIDGVAWGDRYKFTSTTAPVTLDSQWTYNVPNTVPYVKLWIAGPLQPGHIKDATMGLVQTQTMSEQDAAGGRIPGYHDVTAFWGTTSAAGNAGGAYSMPWQDSWPYQANGWSIGQGVSNNNARLTWGTQYGFLGQQSYVVNDGLVATAPGYPKKSYSTYVVLGTNTNSPVEAQVSQVETVQSLNLSATIGGVVTSGPAGVARTDTVTYAPPGYNHVYGALAFTASGNQLDANIAVGAGTLKKPLVIVSSYTGASSPTVRFGGVALTADVDFFASLRADTSELWITLNRDLTGPTNHLEVLSSGGSVNPTILASGPTTFCSGGSVTLTASIAPGAGVTYHWSPGGQTTQAITVTASGSYTVTVTVNGVSGTSPATVVTVTTVTLSPASLPGGTIGSGYSATVTASGGTGPYSWARTGALPAGLTFANGSFTGTPTQNGSFPITVTATDANGCAGSAVYTLIVQNAGCPTLTLSPASLPGGTVGSAYSATVTASGGTGPYTYAEAGTLPSGITFAGGSLTGSSTQSGSFPITVTATDANGCAGSRAYTLVVQAATGCATGGTNLCLAGSRFRVSVTYKNQYAGGQTGGGSAVALTSDTGFFWFFSSSNVELIIKVLDGTGINGRFWVFYGALSDLEYTITITDTQTSAVKTYYNPPGKLGSLADTNAF